MAQVQSKFADGSTRSRSGEAGRGEQSSARSPASSSPITKASLVPVVRHFHLAFKGKDTAEIYDVLMEQLLRAIRKYDPHYKAKMKQVVEVIDEKFAGRRFTLTAINHHLEFDGGKHIELLVRRECLERIRKGEFERTASWPPPAALLDGDGGPIGFTYCVQTWFPLYLQQWITSSMGELETREGVYSLDD